MSTPRILSVGQCGFDHGSIRRTLETNLAVEVAACDTADDAVAQLRRDRFALVLVNRIFDLDGGSGLDLIRQIKADDQLRQTPVMLVSNFPAAQAEAVAAGALPGFGKAALGQKETLEQLRPHLS